MTERKRQKEKDIREFVIMEAYSSEEHGDFGFHTKIFLDIVGLTEEKIEEKVRQLAFKNFKQEPQWKLLDKNCYSDGVYIYMFLKKGERASKFDFNDCSCIREKDRETYGA